MNGHGDSTRSGDQARAEGGGSVAEQEPAAGGATSPSAEPAQPTSEASADTGEGPYTRTPVSRRPLGCLIEIAETLVLTIIIFWLIQTFVAQPYQVQQSSMLTTLEEGQYVLVDKLTPHFDPYNRGDIIVFNPLSRDDSCADPVTTGAGIDATPYIKRVIGEPGDQLELRDGDVLVNDMRLDEAYVNGADTRPLGNDDSWTVPSDRLFVMGDNRDNSTDSRSEQIGMVCLNDVVGRAWLRYWPLSAMGILQTPTYPEVPSAAASPPASLAAPPNARPADTVAR